MRISSFLFVRNQNELRKRGRPSRPWLEALEDRTLLAVDYVTNTNDSGPGSLRAAISSAHTGDTIAIAVSGTITLTHLQLEISRNLDIEGPGANNLTINGDERTNAFEIDGGVSATIAGVTIANCDSGVGAGIDNEGSLSIADCTFSGNTAAQAGGGMFNDGTLSVANSTFSGNSARLGGAGIENDGVATVINCTFSGNSGTFGAGIDNDTVLTLIDSTVSDNSDGQFAAIYSDGTMSLANSIVAANAGPTDPDIHGLVSSLGYNLIGDSSGASGFVPTDLLNVDPLLGPLQDNGGPSQTMALLPGSPAVGAGNDALVPSGFATDERGAPREVFGNVDIGAFQAQVYPVYFTTDSGGGSLRAALIEANQYGGSTIAFETTGTITLASPLPAIGRDVQVLGPGASVLTISGDRANQVFDVDNGVTATIAGLTVADGFDTYGGGISNAGALTVTDSTISDNVALDAGGGILNIGTLTVIDSTVSGDRAALYGGGIANGGTVTITNTTFSGNAASEGGGIYSLAVLTVNDSTLSGNSATSSGGGIAALGRATNLANTIIAANTAPTGPDVGGIVASLGNNLIGNPSGGSGFVASDLLNVNPLLGPLQDNGGPTQTISLLPGSPAIDAGNNALLPVGVASDQRGSPRVVNVHLDIGAFESRGFIITVTSGNNQQAAIGTPFAAPLAVTVSSPDGEPVAGGAITFTAPASNASANFPAGGNTAAINAAGQVSIAVAANSIPGTYTVIAAAAGTPSTLFDLTNTPGPPARLVVHAQPSASATAGQAFAIQPVIYELDTNGNLEAGDNSTRVTVSLESGGSLTGTRTVTVSGGIATFTGLADDRAETAQLVFRSVPALSPATSSNVVISPAQPSQLVIHTQPSATATTGQAFAIQPVIYEEDQFGNLETADSSTKVNASLLLGIGPLMGTTTVTVVGGVATFAGLADNTAETIVLLFTSPGLARAISSAITISAGSGHGHAGTGLTVVNVKGESKSRAKSGRAIRGARQSVPTKFQSAILTKHQPRRSRALAAKHASTLKAVAIEHRRHAVIGRKPAPVRVPLELKARLLADLFALSHGSSGST
jgi:hypothetical protein